MLWHTLRGALIFFFIPGVATTSWFYSELPMVKSLRDYHVYSSYNIHKRLKTKYPEVLSKKALSTNDIGMIQHHFSNYLKNGGIPEYVKFEKPEYLRDLFEGILYRDIIARYKVNDEKPLREVVYYLASNIGKEFSYTKLGKIVGLSSPHTVVNYCNYLEQCYLYFFVNRYSHSLQKANSIQ